MVRNQLINLLFAVP